MANRRMFSRTVVCSGRFLRLRVESQVLYYYLGMEADDDGYAEAYGRLGLTGCTEENLKELEKAGFVTVCDWEDLVVYILDWRRNNLIRADRYTPSIYREVYPMENLKPLEQKSEPQQPEAEAAEEALPQEETACPTQAPFSDASRLTQVRLGKNRLDKNSLDQHRSNQVRFETGASRARDAGNEKSASPKSGEADMIRGENTGNSFDILPDSKHFIESWKPPKKGVPV